MTTKEQKMAAWMLDRAADTFSNHGCNDLDQGFILEAGLTDEEKVQFVREYAKWNGDPDMYGGEDEITAENFDYMPDWLVMRFLAAKLKGDVK